jgi:prophage regulatory protein
VVHAGGVSSRDPIDGWLAYEVDTMLNAFASGKTTEELQAMVKILIEKWQTPVS